MSRRSDEKQGQALAGTRPISGTAPRLPEIRVPAALTFAGLALGIVTGLALRNHVLADSLARLAQPVGTLWLRALQMTIVPLVSSLLFLGITRCVAAAAAGAMARRTLLAFALILLAGAIMAALLTPALLGWSPVPAEAAAALAAGTAPEAALPGLGDFFSQLVPSNVVDVAARDLMLPLVVFVSAFALGTSRLEPHAREPLERLAESIAGAMLVIIGWVLKLAPVGVMALALSLTMQSGAAVVGTLLHYIAIVSLVGLVVLAGAYCVAAIAARLRPLAFARAVLPAQAVALSTQSSLASLPAMIAVARRLGLRESSTEFVLPLAVALFRATSPAMNIAVAIYVAQLAGAPPSPQLIAAGVAIALVTSLGAPALPGSISFIANVGPIALAMGAPLGPLALLVAVEMLPDLMRTVGNVTMDVAVTAMIDHSRNQDEAGHSSSGSSP